LSSWVVELGSDTAVVVVVVVVVDAKMIDQE
jgi:hypothetical protein